MSATVESMVQQARALVRQGRTQEAIDTYLKILRLRPDLPNTWYNLAVEQRKAGAFDDALESYQQCLDRGVRQPEEVHLNRGVIFAEHLHQPDAAKRELQRALALNPRYVPALLNLGNLHEDLGHREAAASAYETALAVEPGSSDALSRLANLTPTSATTRPLIERLRRASADPTVGTAQRATLGFSLGRLLDGAGEYAAAFAAYAAANRDSRASATVGAEGYDRLSEERFIDRIIAAFPTGTRSVTARTTARQTAQPSPIFVCGMFRSGSTLIEQLLGRHPRVRAGGELDFIPRAVAEVLTPFPEAVALLPVGRLQALATRYRDMLGELFPRAEFVTDKRPDNFLYIGLIKLLFPDAKIVHTMRDPLDNCLSIFFLHLDHRMNFALDPLDTGHHYVQYLRLMAHWKRLYGSDIVDVDYDAFVSEPKATAQRLLGCLELEWDDRCLMRPAAGEAVRTASVWQVREPIYQRSSGRARHYERELEELRNYLATARRPGGITAN